MKEYNVGLFPMCADLLHAGHILALREAKKHCRVLYVALNTHPEGKRPVQSVFERWVQLMAVEAVDKVIPYQGRKDLEAIAATFDYDVRFLGSDYSDGEWDGKDQEVARGIPACMINRDHGFSSTELKKRVVAASLMLEDA